MSRSQILLIDNYDSFTCNVREYLGRCAGYANVVMVRNDQIDPEEALEYGAWVISPGPGLPDSSGKLLELIRAGFDKVPMLGICLGHQAIAEAAGGQLYNLGEVRHGRQVSIQWDVPGTWLSGGEQSSPVGLYHSWVVDEKSLPDSVRVLARDEQGIPMALQYRDQLVYGVQFHPESILTPGGYALICGFVQAVRSAGFLL